TNGANVTRVPSALAADEPFDEPAQRAAHPRLEPIRAFERVTRFHGVVARDTEGDVDRGGAGGERAEGERPRRVELLGVERTAEQVAQSARFAQRVDHWQRVDAFEEVLA